MAAASRYVEKLVHGGRGQSIPHPEYAAQEQHYGQGQSYSFNGESMRELPFHFFRAYPSFPRFLKILTDVELIHIEVSSLDEEVNRTGKLALMVSFRSLGRAGEILRLVFHDRHLR